MQQAQGGGHGYDVFWERADHVFSEARLVPSYLAAQEKEGSYRGIVCGIIGIEGLYK